MADVTNPDLATIRSVVDRVIDELGPDASTRQVHDTAAHLLRELMQSPPYPTRATTILLDLPGLDVAARSLPASLLGLLTSGGAGAIRSTVDLARQDRATAIPSRLAAVFESFEANGWEGRLSIAVASTTTAGDLDWIPDALGQIPRLHLTVVCARPGLGLDQRLLDRVTGIVAAHPVLTSGRLTAACMRLPLGRDRTVRVEIHTPVPMLAETDRTDLDPARRQAVEVSARVREDSIPVTTAVAIPLCTPSDAWRSLNAWLSGMRADRVRFDGFRVDDWPARGVRPFRAMPLCASGGDPAPHLLSLAAAGAVAPVCLSSASDPPELPAGH